MQAQEIIPPLPHVCTKFYTRCAPRGCTLWAQMQTPPIMGMVVIGDCHHMTTMDENMKWMKLFLLYYCFSLHLRTSFWTSTYTSKILNSPF